ncbi:hypothetical protein, conserved [Eimeria praecox]|uniref:Cytoplasmic tRNA 2-thiolation protein 2 n=1 Tax=Eimeria praecox TaxID=51316 RepID=U6G6W5_9EIME|nr:hypothetical protein, conserved [Eimeria praecox]
MANNRYPAKPQRLRAADGTFRCYRCPQEVAVANGPQRKPQQQQQLQEQQPQQQQPQQQEQPHKQQLQQQESQKDSHKDAACGLSSGGESESVPLYVAVSGGDASLSLLQLAAESIEKRLSRMHARQQKTEGNAAGGGGGGGGRGGFGAGGGEADFTACIAVHVDIQRLLRPPAAVVEARVGEAGLAGGTQGFGSSVSGVQTAAAEAAAAAAEGGVVVGFAASPQRGKRLPLQIFETASAMGQHVHCVLLHPLGIPFSYVSVEQQEGGAEGQAPIEVYRHPDGRLWGRESLECMQKQEREMRKLLAKTFAADKAIAEKLCRTLMLKALRSYFKSIHNSGCTYTPFLCMGDTASAAALSVLERLSYGEGRCLSLETAAIDTRQSPLFLLCRPLVLLEKKEMALYRLFVGLESLNVSSFAFHMNACTGLAEEKAPTNPYASVRWLLQQFLIDMHSSNNATAHNVSSAVRGLEDPLVNSDTPMSKPCCLCWKVPAVDVNCLLEDRSVFTPKQRQIITEYIQPREKTQDFCFACMRDATAAESAAAFVFEFCLSPAEAEGTA